MGHAIVLLVYWLDNVKEVGIYNAVRDRGCPSDLAFARWNSLLRKFLRYRNSLSTLKALCYIARFFIFASRKAYDFVSAYVPSNDPLRSCADWTRCFFSGRQPRSASDDFIAAFAAAQIVGVVVLRRSGSQHGESPEHSPSRNHLTCYTYKTLHPGQFSSVTR